MVPRLEVRVVPRLEVPAFPRAEVLRCAAGFLPASLVADFLARDLFAPCLVLELLDLPAVVLPLLDGLAEVLAG